MYYMLLNMKIYKLFFLFFILALGFFIFSCVDNSRKIIKEKPDKSSVIDILPNQVGLSFIYERYAITQLNPNDFSWKFIEEYDESGKFIIIAEEKKFILNNPNEPKKLFKISTIHKGENGFIAITDLKNIIIFATDYNRIAVGHEGSLVFKMYIFKDKDREKINIELQKMI